jgi:hypothetical protein
MIETDLIAAIRQNDNVIVKDLYATKEAEPPLDEDIGGSDDLEVISTELYDEGFKVTFSRPLETGDIYDKKLSPGMSMDACWASLGKESFSKHNSYGHLKMKFGLTKEDSELEDSSSVLSVVIALLALLVV